MTLEFTKDDGHYAVSINGSVPVIVGTLKQGVDFALVGHLIDLSVKKEDIPEVCPDCGVVH